MSHVQTDDYLAAWNERLLVDYLDEAAVKHPDRAAIVDFEYGTNRQIELTFAQLRRRVDQIAWSLYGLGVRRGDVVSVQLPNWWHFVAAHLACLRVGAATNPLMPIFRERELSFMLGLAESRVVIVPKVFRDFDHEAMIERIRPSLPSLRHVIVAGGTGSNSFDRQLLADQVPPDAAKLFAAQRLTADDVVQLLYTSGTTGEPKGVMHTSRTLLTTMLPSIRHLQLREGEPILSATPLAHQLGFILAVIVPIALGSPIVMQDVWNAAVALERIRKFGVTFAMGATPFLADLIDTAAKEGDAGPLRTFLSAGAPIPRTLVKRAREEIGVKVLSAYGMTENLLVSSARPDDPEQKVSETDGAPSLGLELRVVDNERKPLPSGQSGRLQTRGTSIFIGYLKRPELYNVDGDGWFDTGDLARLDADGYVTITGRWKDVIIRGGENVPVVEIENVLYRHPAVRQVAIVAMPDARLGERACAFVVPREAASLAFADMQEFLQKSGVARSYWPERLEVVDAMPMTASGKIQKFVLRERAKELVHAQQICAADKGQ
ncbi:MAG: AMP-binding protein [Bradyrhizobium sp.]|uniref:AMP-binding protein n=1 Tax=Bradyrhizobium sp. TaxID=376 RepID=UPI001E0E4C1E|nr:AMP-binding protein [Bradyrhizobium sp.]MBV9559573.1 AMP-binding protein [Bradyrhizobium sp.]